MSTEKGLKTKKRIIGTAAGLIHRNGYNRTSLDDILSGSGITKGSFYHHFTSKEGVCIEVIDHFFSYVEYNIFKPALKEKIGAVECIDKIFEKLGQAMEMTDCLGGCLLGNLALEVSDYNDELRLHLLSKCERMREIISTVITDGQKRGEIRNDRSARELTNFLISVFEGGLMLAKVKKDITPFRDAQKLAIDFIRP